LNFGSPDATTQIMNDLFDFQPPARDYAVMGNPVSHSLSPLIHDQFARQFDIHLNYTRIQVDPGGFHQAVSHFSAHGGAGLNITVPFKQEAWEFCRQGVNRLTERAEIARAVNTLAFTRDEGTLGDNTDGAGLLRDIENNLGLTLKGKRILVIGAGGAARGVLRPLLSAGPTRVHVINRTESRARQLVEQFAHGADGRLSAGPLGSVDGAFELVINATAASLDHAVPDISPACIADDTTAYDMMYGKEPTAFMSWAVAHHAGAASDGLGMLVEQAAESFLLWHGVRPETGAVINLLRNCNH
jgi:shikimate dehydrogenase